MAFLSLAWTGRALFRWVRDDVAEIVLKTLPGDRLKSSESNSSVTSFFALFVSLSNFCKFALYIVRRLLCGWL